jgi:hypothetical protein
METVDQIRLAGWRCRSWLRPRPASCRWQARIVLERIPPVGAAGHECIPDPHQVEASDRIRPIDVAETPPIYRGLEPLVTLGGPVGIAKRQR